MIDDIRIRVKLMSHDGKTKHAEGYIAADKLEDTSQVKRKGRVYSFASLVSGSAQFCEVLHQPYEITEF